MHSTHSTCSKPFCAVPAHFPFFFTNLLELLRLTLIPSQSAKVIFALARCQNARPVRSVMLLISHLHPSPCRTHACIIAYAWSKDPRQRRPPPFAMTLAHAFPHPGWLDHSSSSLRWSYAQPDPKSEENKKESRVACGVDISSNPPRIPCARKPNRPTRFAARPPWWLRTARTARRQGYAAATRASDF